MGVVYRAEDMKLGRYVALKFLTHLGGVGAEYADRLKREARTLAALNHVNIVTIYDLDEFEGVPFLVLEWIDGTSLDDPRHPKPSDEETFLHLAIPIAEALAAAHERGIVHRDVKPANVLVSREGRVKLADFGLAKFREGEVDHTRTAALLGTVAYMSPEQASGLEPAPASDVFSFGSLAYELLTGRRPFDRAGIPATLHAIVHEPHAPLESPVSSVSAAVHALVDRCLAKAPERRFRTGAELASELQRLARALPSRSVGDLSTRTGSGSGRLGSTPEVRFCTTADGTRIAYSVLGAGPVLVRVLGWFTHLEMEWEWPAMRLLWERLAEYRTVVRYDGRGIGLSDPWTGAFTEETRQLDLDAVLNAVDAKRVSLFGISEGGWTASLYAVKCPERVVHLILYGAYARGAAANPGFDEEVGQALLTLVRKGWGKDTPVFRQIFTNNYFGPNAEPGLVAHFNQLQRASADPDTAVRFIQGLRLRGDGSEFLARIRTPTLVLHCRDDQVVQFEEGRRLASVIPGARLVPLPSGTHYFPTEREVTSALVDAILDFSSGAE